MSLTTSARSFESTEKNRKCPGKKLNYCGCFACTPASSLPAKRPCLTFGTMTTTSPSEAGLNSEQTSGNTQRKYQRRNFKPSKPTVPDGLLTFRVIGEKIKK